MILDDSEVSIAKKENWIYSNKTLIGLILLSLFCALIGLCINFFNGRSNLGYTLMEKGVGTAQIIGIFMLISNGTTFKTRYWKLILVFIPVIITGALFKIIHWHFADHLLLAGLFAIPSIYLIRFITKKKKGHLDILKLLWVVTAFTFTSLILMHCLSKSYSPIPGILILVTVCDFIIVEFKNKNKIKEQPPF